MLKRFLITVAVVLSSAVASAQQPVTVASSALPSGASTSAKQDTLQTVIDALKTATDTINTNIATGVATNSSVRIISNAGAADDEDETQVKATAGVLSGISAFNSHASTDAYVKCTNLTAANTTPGSSTIVYSALIPHGGGMVDRGIEMAFSVAMTCYVVTGKADNDTTDAGTGDVLVNIQYR